MAWPEARSVFEGRVAGLALARINGWDCPPLIVQYTEGRLVVSDGNHRHEALARLGTVEYPMLLWATGPVEGPDLVGRWGPWAEVDRLHRQGRAEGRQGVVGLLVVGPDGRVFSQRRSATRRLFPGCWDLVGGHVEAGESPRAALVRELAEETGWTLDRVLGLRKVVDWESPGPDGAPLRKREFVLAVTVTGGWDRPRLEADKVSEGRWFGPEDLPVLLEGRTGSDAYVHDLVRDFFAAD